MGRRTERELTLLYVRIAGTSLDLTKHLSNGVELVSSYHPAMWSLFQVLLVTSLLFSTTFAHGQSSEHASPQGTPSANTQSSFRTYSFKNIKAADALKALMTINGVSEEEIEATGGIVINERRNSIIFRLVPGEEQGVQEVEEFFKLLDVEIPISANGARITPATTGVAPSVQTFTFSVGFERGESIELLKQRYTELEQQTHDLAGKLKQSKSLSETERKDLQTAVRKSFEARQALQRAELADLAQRMQSMQQSIDMRDKLADKVIERRVEDLLNPILKWDLLAAKKRTLDGPNSESALAIAPAAQAAPNISRVTPEGSAYLPPSIAPTPISSPYDPGKRPETIMMERIQGHWIAESMISAGKDSLSDYSEPFEVLITGNEMRFKVGDQDLRGVMLLTWRKGSNHSLVSADQPMPIDIVMDPNGENREMLSIIACNGTTLSICVADEDESKSGFRPSSFIPGSKVVVIKCYRLTPTVAANKPGAANLSTPQATLEYLHRYSLTHPGGFPAECYTDEAILELSGMMLQNLAMMSALSQIALQTGGVIGESNGVPVVSDTSPAFHILVETLLKEQMLPKPPESADKAFELLAKLTFGSDSSNPTASVQVDRQLLRLAAGVLKSPKEFLPAASKLLETFGKTDADVTKSKEAVQTPPKADIAINGDEATATFLRSSNVASPSPLSAPRVTKLRRIDGRWLISEILSDEEITQLQSSYSSVMDQLGAAEEVKSDNTPKPATQPQKTPNSAIESSNTKPSDWNEFLRQVPESGTALVMFSYEPEIKEQMLPVAKKVAEAASAELIELPLTQWRKILSPEATHFVLMKDRQLVGTRTGLMTEARLQDFVAKAKDWLTPQSTGIDEDSLVRIDCYINPGPDNIGSQHGGAYPLTTVVVAVHEDQALLFGPESIAEYLEKGYACVAIARDASGNEKQVPMDVLLNGPVKLLGRSEKQPKSAASMNVTFGDGTSREVPLPGVASIYPKLVTELLEAYDVGSAIYHIRGVHGLKPVRLAAIKDAPIVNQRVLSGSFMRERHVPPLHGFLSPIHWQSQTVPRADGGIYGGNINGPEMFEVLCPTRPAPCGFTFNEQGRLIGMYGLGGPTEKDMTHSVFRPDSTHSILLAALEKIDAPGLRAALAQTLEESKTAASNKDENRPAAVNAANANTLQSSTNPKAKFDTPQALLARVDESSKAGSYEEFISLFSDEGVRDLAGSMLMQAVMQTSIDELTQQMSGGLAEVNPDFVAFRKVLQRWLPQSVTTAQQEAMGKGLSTIMSSIGGASPDHAALNEFVISLRESVAGISDHPKFCIEIMQAFEKLTKRKFVFFGNADHENEWQISQFGDRAIATLIDGSPGMATTITMQQANGTWRISSLFNELVIETQPAAPSPTSTTKPKYSGQPISWWLDSYWDNAMASHKTPENTAQEYVASEAIRKLRGKPECKAAIETALAKWFASVENEVNEIQLVRAAKCFVTAAGPEYQELAVDYLCKIWRQLPTLSLENQVELALKETDLNELLKEFVLNDELANKFAERLTNGTSSDRSLVMYYLISRTGLKDEKDPRVAELNTWLHNHREIFFPAFAAALKDESEQVRWFSLPSLIVLDPKYASILSTITSVIESDASPKVRWLAIEMISSKEILSVAKTQNIEVAPLMIKTLEHDSSIDVRNAALGALMAMDKDSELVHATLREWARSKDRLQVENALSLMLRNHEAGDRPQSIDELIELLSDPEWGMTVEVNYNNWSTHHRWARQYALAILGRYAAHAHRAIPTLEAELARNNKDTLSFATNALDRVRGYCPDRPIDQLQGEWEFVSMQKPESSTPFFDLQASSDQQPASLITIRGTQFKLGDRVLAELSHPRSSNGVALLLDPNGKKRLHCNGRYDFNPEFLTSSPRKLEWVKLEVCELLEDSIAMEKSKQTYVFRPFKREPH